MMGRKTLRMRDRFGEPLFCDMDEEVIALWNSGPKSLIKHPVGVGRQGKAVARVVISRDRMLMDMGGLDDGGGFGVESVTGQGTSEVVAAEDITFEATVSSLLLTGLVFYRLLTKHPDFLGARGLQAQAGREHDLFARGKVDHDQGFAGLASKSRILETSEKSGIERAEAGGGLGFGRETIGGKGLPNLVPRAAEGVEGHGDVRLVALAFEHQFPVIAESGNQTDVVFHPAVGNLSRFDKINDGEQHQWLVGRNPTGLGAGSIQASQPIKPIGKRFLIHDNHSRFLGPGQPLFSQA